MQVEEKKLECKEEACLPVIIVLSTFLANPRDCMCLDKKKKKITIIIKHYTTAQLYNNRVEFRKDGVK